MIKNLTSLYGTDDLSDNITLVTAYFDLGQIRKGPFHTQDFAVYQKWSSAYKFVANPLIFFTDSEQMAELFLLYRKNLPKNATKVVLIKSDELWAFSKAKLIKKIFSDPAYPKFSPNTINENYSCTMHAKYDLLEKVIKEKWFRTKFLAWVDIGYFRNQVDETHKFHLKLPEDFSYQHISFTEINEFNKKLTPMGIIDENAVWVGGGMILGRLELMTVFISDYKEAVGRMLDEKLMSTDQQVIYIMYSNKLPGFTPKIQIQTHTLHTRDWFHLGRICGLPVLHKRRMTDIFSYL